MKVAIIGAGFCGLAVAWNLLNHPSLSINLQLTLYDTKGIGAGASGIATGLLHPYVGADAKLNWRGKEGITATRQLLAVSEKALGQSVTANDKGILRLAISQKQRESFQQSPALQDPSVEWLDEEHCQGMIAGCAKAPGLWIKNGLTVYSSLYLEGLWLACAQKGAHFEQRHFSSWEELQEFSLCIVTTGASMDFLANHLPFRLRKVKGQVLELSWPSELPILPYALNSQAYIVMKPSQTSCLVGSSYEKDFDSEAVDLDKAMREIMPKALQLLPALSRSTVIQGHAGIRAVAPNHLPFIEQLSPKIWMLSGMGSKGLLYHALMAKELMEKLSQSFGS